ncbi:hypothetical protein BCR35DRAFT_300977 [Leucosporidium creatinivorum]|uniref:Uncharacterized protein n=1 Tax=Leucosporidium creatinivorum TaxID=106004 RepID=A0A1Y2FYM6_9BASI|nr:hypothetical protein BCR35DRAFT_300977 [Leucosporidium creatinivorum]
MLESKYWTSDEVSSHLQSFKELRVRRATAEFHPRRSLFLSPSSSASQSTSRLPPERTPTQLKGRRALPFFGRSTASDAPEEGASTSEDRVKM